MEGESGAAISQRSVISEHRTERDAREAAAQERRRLEVIRAEEAASWVISVVRGGEVLHTERPFDGRRDAVPASPLEPLVISQVAPGEPGPEQEQDPAPDAGAHDDDAADAGIQAEDGTGDRPADDAGDGEADDESPAQAAQQDVAQVDERRIAEGAGAEAIGAPPAADVPLDPAPEFSPGAAEPDDDGRDAGATGRVLRGDRDADGGSPRRDREPTPSGPVPEEIIRRFEEAIAREREREERRGH